MQIPGPRTENLLARLAARCPDSAAASVAHTALRHAADDLVRHLSPEAAAFLATLPAPEPGAVPAPVGLVPPALGEEIFAFADYALLDDLYLPAVDAVMRSVSPSRAVELLDVCCEDDGARGLGYQALKQRCTAFVAEHLARCTLTDAYRNLLPQQRTRVDAAVRGHVQTALTSGAREDLRQLADAIAAHASAGHLAPADLERPPVFAWLCEDAPPRVWEALAAGGHDVVAYIMRERSFAFRAAAGAGRDDLVAFMWEATPPAKRDALWTACGHGAIFGAVRRGCGATVCALLERLSPEQRGELPEDITREAVQSGKGGAVVEALGRWYPEHASLRLKLWYLARSNLHEEIAVALHEVSNHPPPPGDWLEPAWREACCGGHLETARVILRAVADDVELLKALCRNGFTRVLAECERGAPAEALVEVLEQAALAVGCDLLADFCLQDAWVTAGTLIKACTRGHLQLVARVLDGMSEAQRRPFFFPFTASRGPMVLACQAGQPEMVNMLLARVGSPAQAAELVLRDDNLALIEATRSGNVELVKTLCAVVRQDPVARDAWQDRSLHRRGGLYALLKFAATSNEPAMLHLWLNDVPEDRRRAALVNTCAVSMAMQGRAPATLTALFEMVAGDAPLRDHLVGNMMASQTGRMLERRELDHARREAYAAGLDVVLDHVPAAQRSRVLIACFSGLCQTDPSYFRRQWATLADADRAAVLTPGLWRNLPAIAGAENAVQLVREHTASFVEMLADAGASRGWIVEDALYRAAAKAVIEAVTPEIRAQIFHYWGANWIKSVRTSHDPEFWDLLCRHVSREDMLDCLNQSLAPGIPYDDLDDMVDIDRLDFPHAVHDAHNVLPYVLLSGEWLTQPEQYGELGRRALEELVERDHVTLCRELLAHYPEAEQMLPRPLPEGIAALLKKRGTHPVDFVPGRALEL